MLPGKKESMNEPTLIAVDLAKSVFEVAVSPRGATAPAPGPPGAVAERGDRFDGGPIAA